jgi:hypothetical protein
MSLATVLHRTLIELPTPDEEEMPLRAEQRCIARMMGAEGGGGVPCAPQSNAGRESLFRKKPINARMRSLE